MTHEVDIRDVLVLKRIFKVPVEKVFDAWTKPEILAEWFGPEGFSVIRSEVHLNVGGSYHIDICSPDGKQISHYGSYLEISRPHRLAFTWMLADQACKDCDDLLAETIVSIEFKPIEQHTELTLTHEQLPDKDAYDGHKFGWTSSLDSLSIYLK